MEERFSDLSRVSFNEYETIGSLAFWFFGPDANVKLRDQYGKKLTGCMLPFSGNDFYRFLLEKSREEYERKIHKIRRILSMLERSGILQNMGRSTGAYLGNTYFSLKELSTLQKRNCLWFGEAFGFSFLQEKLKDNVVHITGHGKDGRIGNGTGFLVNSKTVLTCKHVMQDMEPDEVICISGKEYTYSTDVHESLDIALLHLSEAVSGISTFPAFNDADVLDEVLTMGYPPIPGSAHDYLLSQKGEVNSVVYDYLSKANNLVLSSVTRPGNSGGPVISKNGYLVGMVTQYNESRLLGATPTEEEKDRFPFYMAMQGKALYDGIKEIDPDNEVFFEDYQ